MVRSIFVGLMCLSIVHSSARAERGTVELVGDGPFSISVGDSVKIYDVNHDNVEFEIAFARPDFRPFAINQIGTGTRFGMNGQYLKDFVVFEFRPTRSATIEFKVIATSRMPNGPRKARTVRVDVQ